MGLLAFDQVGFVSDLNHLALFADAEFDFHIVEFADANLDVTRSLGVEALLFDTQFIHARLHGEEAVLPGAGGGTAAFDTRVLILQPQDGAVNGGSGRIKSGNGENAGVDR